MGVTSSNNLVSARRAGRTGQKRPNLKQTTIIVRIQLSKL